MSKKTAEETPQLYNVQSAAELLGVNAGTIRRWAHTKQLSGIKVGIRGDWRFTKQELMQMVGSNHATSQFALEVNAKANELDSLKPKIHTDESHDHFVQFYETDTFLVDSVLEFISKGDCAIVVATKERRYKIEEGLKKVNWNLDKAKEKGTFISLDAEETLSKFMVNNLPDAKLFFEVIGVLIMQAKVNNSRVRVFGEMVAYLWANGNRTAAIQLEKLWNDLQKTISFSLVCAYPMNLFSGESHAAQFSEMCRQHTSVVPSEDYMSLTTDDERMREVVLLQQKAQSLEEEIEKRKRLEKQKDEFIGVVSHELKTPVTSLKVFTQVLQNRFKKEGRQDTAEHLGKMNMQINKLTTLIEDLLDITKLQTGKLKFNMRSFSFDDLTVEIIEEIQRTTQTHTIAKTGSVRKKVRGDRDRIGQVITNLLTNAIKYSPDTNKIDVTIIENHKDITLEIRDYGIGISKKDQKRIFERFYREQGDAEDTFPGLGLGLYISSEIIKRHNGTISVRSQKGKGSTFSFSLPLQQRAQVAHAL